MGATQSRHAPYMHPHVLGQRAQRLHIHWIRSTASACEQVSTTADCIVAEEALSDIGHGIKEAGRARGK